MYLLMLKWGFGMKIPEGRQSRLWLSIPTIGHNPDREFNLRVEFPQLKRGELMLYMCTVGAENCKIVSECEPDERGNRFNHQGLWRQLRSLLVRADNLV